MVIEFSQDPDRSNAGTFLAGRSCLGRVPKQEGNTAESVSISALSAGMSPRLDGENLAHVQILAASEASLPPILVHRQTMQVVDGMHRLRAADLRGQDTVDVLYFDGNESDAFVAAVRANIAHGLPLTLADREAAASRIIRALPDRSDRWIAQATGLAAGTVGVIRRRIGQSATDNKARVGRDGRVRPLNSAEGRLRARAEILSNPGASLREIARAAGISPATARDVRKRMHRGEDPVPRDSDGGHVTPDTRHDHSPRRPTPRRDLGELLQELRKDPSLRYSEPGRLLLRWLEFLARGPGTAQTLVRAVPPHCGYVVAEIVRSCAQEWQEFAAALEKHLSEMG